MDKLACSCNRLIFAALNTELRHVLQDSPTLLPTTAFPLASPCQSHYPLYYQSSVVIVTKTTQVYRFGAKISTFFNSLIQRLNPPRGRNCDEHFHDSRYC